MKAKNGPGPAPKGAPGLSILKINKSEPREECQEEPLSAASPPPLPTSTGAQPRPSLKNQSPPQALEKRATPSPQQDLSRFLGMAPRSTEPRESSGHNQAPGEGEKPQMSFTPRSVDDVDFDEASFQSALDESTTIGGKGQEVAGTVTGHETDGIYVDIGGKAPGWLPKQECGFGVITDLVEQFPKGKELKMLVTSEQNAEGMVTVSCRALMMRDSWKTVARLAQEAAVVQTTINGFNRGGCTCHVEGLRGFIPRSQLVDGENHSALVGKTLGVTFLEVHPETSKLVLSEKRASRAQRFAELKVGDLVTGQVSGIKRFGCFIDLGAISGLLHQNSISAGHIRSLEQLFTVGETISALVTHVDAGRGRIALNTALLENMPGEMLLSKADVMNQAEHRAERARSLLLQEQQQEQEPPENLVTSPAQTTSLLPGDHTSA